MDFKLFLDALGAFTPPARFSQKKEERFLVKKEISHE